MRLPKVPGQIWPEQLPFGELPLTIMAVAGVLLIAVGWILRRWIRSADAAEAEYDPWSGRQGVGLASWLVIGVGGFLLGAGFVGIILTFWGDPMEGWLRSLSGGSSVPVALADVDAETLFDTYCVNCHGQSGDKVSGLALFSPEYLAQHSDSAIAAAIARGTSGMPGFKLAQGRGFTENQIMGLVKYLRSNASKVLKAVPSPTPTPDIVSIPGFETFKDTCSCHVRASMRRWDDRVLRPADVEAHGSRGLHDFTGGLSEDQIEALVRFIVWAQQTSEGGAPFGGIIRHVDGWKQRHPDYVKGEGASFCYQCHVNTFCIRCHTQGRFPPPTSSISSADAGGN